MALTKVTYDMIQATGTPNSNTFLRGDGTWSTGNTQILSTPGTSGNVLTSNGTSWTSVALPRVLGQAFTSSGTFTIPSGVTAIKITVVGGGGAGGSGSTTSSIATGGGGGGGTAISYLTSLTPGNTLAVTIGGGGSGASTGNAGSGGTSSVASGTQTITTVQATGGGTGPGSGGAGSGGIINIGGGGGGVGVVTFGGSGGSSTLGGGAVGSTTGTGNAGRLYGGGGGGGYNHYIQCGCCPIPEYVTGGAGGSGIVIFEW